MASLNKPNLLIYSKGEFRRSKVLASDHKHWMELNLQQQVLTSTFDSMISQKDPLPNPRPQLEV